MKLILIRGLPGSGKSTLAKTYTELGYIHIEADMYFMNGNSYIFDPTHLPSAHKWCKDTTLVAIKQKRNIVVANTFTTYPEIEPYVNHAKAFGYEIEVLETTGEYESVHAVPILTIERMKSRWESTEVIVEKINNQFGE